MNTKNILIYGGGALVLGAVTYFVWSFFQKPSIPIGGTTIDLGSGSEEETEDNQGSGVKYDFTPMQFDPIEVPNIYDNINNFPLMKSNQ